MDKDEKKSVSALREEAVLQFWKENNIFEESLKKEAPKGKYVFYDGPPFATGLPHYGHILGSTVKDVIGRYKTMSGYNVPRRWGWDCHGLPIENIVEKDLGISGKKAIEELGIDKEMIKIILSKSFGESLATRDSNNWPLKILYYADLRTLPLGIGTLEARMQDVRNRMPKYTSRPDFEDLVHACKDLELQLQSNLSKSVFEINDKVINKFISKAEVFDL